MASSPHRAILVLFAHPAQDRSQVNVRLARAAERVAGVTVCDVYARYPTYEIDVDAEQALLREHDVIVFLHPFYWYSTPALLKEWQDLVLEYGFAYGTNGTALQGKLFLNALTAGGPREAYDARGYNNYPLRDLLRPLEQTADLCGMRYLAPFALFDARNTGDAERLQTHERNWVRLLEALRDDRVDLDQAVQAELLNDALDAIIRAPAAPTGA